MDRVFVPAYTGPCWIGYRSAGFVQRVFARLRAVTRRFTRLAHNSLACMHSSRVIRAMDVFAIMAIIVCGSQVVSLVMSRHPQHGL